MITILSVNTHSCFAYTYTDLQMRLFDFSTHVLKLKWNEPLIDVLVESRCSLLSSSDLSDAVVGDEFQSLSSSLRSVQTFGLCVGQSEAKNKIKKQ